jgi:hypothetical protein
MRKGGGKSKGGAYEILICRILAKAFAPFGALEDDFYRTKNSGSTKSAPGDIQISPAIAKLFPALIEAKHYRTISWRPGKPIQNQLAVFRKWWQQTEREQKAKKDRFALLVFRANHCPDMVAFKSDAINVGNFKNIIKTSYKSVAVWIVPLADFLKRYTYNLQERDPRDVKGQHSARNNNKQKPQNRNGSSLKKSSRKMSKRPRS